MTLHDPLLGDLYSPTHETGTDVEEAAEDTPAPDLWDSFAAGCARCRTSCGRWQVIQDNPPALARKQRLCSRYSG